MPTLLDHLRRHLIVHGIGRDPRTPGPLPPIWRQGAADSLPAPGEGAHVTEIGATAVIGLRLTGGIATRRFDLDRRREIVRVEYRTRNWPLAFALDAAVRSACLIDETLQWDLAGLTVIQATEWTAFQPLLPPSQPGVHDYQRQILFEVYADALV